MFGPSKSGVHWVVSAGPRPVRSPSLGSDPKGHRVTTGSVLPLVGPWCVTSLESNTEVRGSQTL